MARDYAETLRELQAKADDPAIPEAERSAFKERIELFKTKVNTGNNPSVVPWGDGIYQFTAPDIDSIYEEVFKYGDDL